MLEKSLGKLEDKELRVYSTEDGFPEYLDYYLLIQDDNKIYFYETLDSKQGRQYRFFAIAYIQKDMTIKIDSFYHEVETYGRSFYSYLSSAFNNFKTCKPWILK